MKETVSEYGFTVVTALICAALFLTVFGFFQDGGAIKEFIIDYVSKIC